MPRDTRSSTTSATDLPVTISKQEIDSLVASAVAKAVEEAIKTTTTFFQKKMEELSAVCAKQQEEIDSLTAQVREAERATNQLEQYSRRSHIRIHGLSLDKSVDCKQSVCNFINTNLKDRQGKHMSLALSDLDAAHPLPNKDKTKPPAVIVRFHERDLRDSVIAARRQLKGKRVRISEDLTAKNAKLLHQLQSSDKYESAWSWQGKIFAKQNSSSRPQRFDI